MSHLRQGDFLVGRSNALVLRLSVPHVRRRHRSRVYAFGADPYAPLEKAIQVINQVLSLGESAQWRGSEEGGDSGSGDDSDGRPPPAERWVQFGAVSSSQIAVAERLALLNVGSSQGAAPPRMLRNYLALPVEEYALLDPKWIQRDAAESDTFRFCVPLNDVIGVQLQPEITVTARPDPAAGRVTLVGTRAALGSPDIDDAFRLNMVAVLSRRQRRRLPRIPRPDHLPGRPVYRLRRWAARARGRTWPAPHTAADGADESAGADAGELERDLAAQGEGDGLGAAAWELQSALEEATAGGAVDLATAAPSAPFPSEQIYISRDDADSDEGEDDGSALYGSSEEEHRQSALLAPHASDVASGAAWPAPAEEQALPAATDLSGAATAGDENSAQLHCRVSVTVAVRVPGPLRVVPNPLLGYAGGLILRAALSATLPNFLTLLAADFQRWADDGDDGGRDAGKAAGELFAVPQQDS